MQVRLQVEVEVFKQIRDMKGQYSEEIEELRNGWYLRDGEQFNVMRVYCWE